MQPSLRARAWIRLWLVLPLALAGCTQIAYGIAIPFLYTEVELPEERVVRDVAYRDDPAADPRKHRLDLGVGAAVISYRLQPDVDWRDQVDDVERAVAWLRARVSGWGGNPRAIFVSGHSAGAQLVTGAALAPSARFARAEDGEAWTQDASVVRLARREVPPALILYGAEEPSSLQRQAAVLDEALRAQGAESRIVVVPGQTHASIVLTLSRPDRSAAPAMLEFIRSAARSPRC